MKKLTKILALLTVMVAFSTATFAQVSANATATATIITPIAIANSADMNFGNVAVSAVAGTVVLTPAAARSVTGGVTLPAVTGTVSAAAFDVTGEANFAYSITLPAAATTITSGANTMTVDIWTSTPTVVAGGTLDGTGAQTILVGATLNVGASQPSGVYVSGTPFAVTVNYN